MADLSQANSLLQRRVGDKHTSPGLDLSLRNRSARERTMFRRQAAVAASLLAVGLLFTTPSRAYAQPTSGAEAYARAALRVASSAEKASIEAGALSLERLFDLAAAGCFGDAALRPITYVALKNGLENRSEERRVGKECRL